MFYPVMICTFAGLATAAGGGAVLIKGSISKRGLSIAQGFAAGVMLAVSVLELVPESYSVYYTYMPVFTALKAVGSLFLAGWIIGGIISMFTLSENFSMAGSDNTDIWRIALITMAVMVLHNLPEGMLTVFTSSADISYGIKMAVAVALHNIPEGMAVASPVFYATGSRFKAFMWSFAAGMAEPVGGIIAYTVLKDIITPAFLNGFMPMVAGVMCQAALCELIPSAVSLSNIKHTFYGIITGIAVMAIGLFVF